MWPADFLNCATIFYNKNATPRAMELEGLGDSIGELEFASWRRCLPGLVAKLSFIIGPFGPYGAAH